MGQNCRTLIHEAQHSIFRVRLFARVGTQKVVGLGSESRAKGFFQHDVDVTWADVVDTTGQFRPFCIFQGTSVNESFLYAFVRHILGPGDSVVSNLIE